MTGTTSWDPRVASLSEDTDGGLGDGTVVAICVGCIGGVVSVAVVLGMVCYRRVKSGTAVVVYHSIGKGVIGSNIHIEVNELFTHFGSRF